MVGNIHEENIMVKIFIEAGYERKFLNQLSIGCSAPVCMYVCVCLPPGYEKSIT